METIQTQIDSVEHHDKRQHMFAATEKVRARIELRRHEFDGRQRTGVFAKSRVVDPDEGRRFCNVSAGTSNFVE